MDLHPAPTFLLIGAARSGTTTVVESLRRHPDVFVTTPKEPHFFAYAGQQPAFTGPGDQRLVNEVAVTDPGAYAALYADAGPFAVRGEGSVSTLYRSEDAVAAIRRWCPDARLVAVLRDPVARAHSAHQYLLAGGHEPEPDLAVALALEDERVEAGYQHLWHYRRMGRYGEQLATFVDAFGPDQVGIWFHDDLVADGSQVLGEICRHIGAPDVGLVPQERLNASGTPRNARLQRVLAPDVPPALKRLARRAIPYGWWHRLRAANLRENEVPAAVASDLRRGYEDDLALLRRLVGPRPLPDWLRA